MHPHRSGGKRQAHLDTRSVKNCTRKIIGQKPDTGAIDTRTSDWKLGGVLGERAVHSEPPNPDRPHPPLGSPSGPGPPRRAAGCIVSSLRYSVTVPKPDPYAQDFPDYDTGDPGYSEPASVSSLRKPKRRGKISREGQRKKVARWRSKNSGKYRAYMRQYMAQRRAAARASVAVSP